jgi:hypothetical protein
MRREFFDYKPYKTFKFPEIISNIVKLLCLDSFLGENYVIKVKKSNEIGKDKILNVIFKHY